MTQFTKEQLIEHAHEQAAILQRRIKNADDEEWARPARQSLALLEVALAALKAEPFMYGIVAPEGEAYFDECCVSGGKSDLSEIVSNLNDQCESPGEEYREVPLYRLPLLEGLK